MLGEYSVLHGHGALIAAVEHRVLASFRAGGDALMMSSSLSTTPARVDSLDSGFGKAWAGVAAAGEWSGQRTPMYGALHIDSTALYDPTGRKLGFGSSAAVVVACAGATSQKPLTAEAFALLRDWHNRAQDSTGSGGDVAASLLGGLVWLEQGVPTRLPAAPPPLAVFKHAQAASTPSLTKQIRAFAGRAAHEYGALETRLVAAATRGRTALKEADLASWVTACRDANAALDELGQRAKVAIVNDAHRALVAKVEAAGGACKPSGAGGGDLSLVTTPDEATLQRLIDELGLERVVVAATGLETRIS